MKKNKKKNKRAKRAKKQAASQPKSTGTLTNRPRGNRTVNADKHARRLAWIAKQKRKLEAQES